MYRNFNCKNYNKTKKKGKPFEWKICEKWKENVLATINF